MRGKWVHEEASGDFHSIEHRCVIGAGIRQRVDIPAMGIAEMPSSENTTSEHLRDEGTCRLCDTSLMKPLMD
jgi:hypothetical protein